MPPRPGCKYHAKGPEAQAREACWRMQHKAFHKAKADNEWTPPEVFRCPKHGLALVFGEV